MKMFIAFTAIQVYDRSRRLNAVEARVGVSTAKIVPTTALRDSNRSSCSPGRGWNKQHNSTRSIQQLANHGFDVNRGCIEKLNTRSAGVAQ